MDKFEHYKQQLDKDLADETKPWSKYLKLAEEKTGVNRSYIFLGEFIQKKSLQFFISGEKIIVCFSPATTTANNLVCIMAGGALKVIRNLLLLVASRCITNH